MTIVSGQLDEVRSGVWRLVANNPGYMTGPGTNTYLLGRDNFLVVDPGPVDETHQKRILEATRGRICSIMVTHTHPDHSPGAQSLAALSGAEVLGRAPSEGGHQEPGCTLTRELHDGEVLRVDDLHVLVLHTPGHASNHLCFLVQEHGLLLTGDHLMQGSTVVIAPPDGDMQTYLQSLRRLQTEPVRALAPGHGTVIDDAQMEIVRVIAHRLKREAKVIEKLKLTGPTTLQTLVPLVYDDVDTRLHGMARYSLLAHLMKLRDEGKVLQANLQDEGPWLWADPRPSDLA